MKVIIRLNQFERRNEVARVLLRIIQQDAQMQQQINANGLYFDNLTSREVSQAKEQLAGLNYSSYKATDSSVHLLTQNNDITALLKVTVTLLRTENELAKILWRRGLNIGSLTQEQAETLKEHLEEQSAQVTIAADSRPAQRKYTVQGTVAQEDGTVTPNLAVHIFHYQNSRATRLGQTLTSSQGFYTLSYNWNANSASAPNLVVRVYNSDNQVIGENKRDNATAQKTIDVIVKPHEIPQTPDDSYIVRGFVHQEDGSVLRDMLVQAFDHDLRHEQLLGEIQTDKKSFYQIQYFSNQFREQEKGNADLVVKVRSPSCRLG